MYTRFLLLLIFPVIIAAGKFLSSAFFDWEKVTAQKTHTGWTRSFLKGQTRDLEILEIEAFTLYPGKITHSYLIDSHDENLYIVKEGTAEIIMNNVTRELPEGGVLVASQGNRVVIRNRSSSSLVYYSIRLKPKFFKPIPKPQKKASGFYLLTDTVKEQITMEGSLRTLLNRPTSLLKNLDIHAVTLKSDFNRIEQQTGSQDEFIIIRNGIVFGTLKGKSFKLGKGSVIFLTSDNPIEISNGSEDACEYFVVRWSTWSQAQKKQ